MVISVVPRREREKGIGMLFGEEGNKIFGERGGWSERSFWVKMLVGLKVNV